MILEWIIPYEIKPFFLCSLADIRWIMIKEGKNKKRMWNNHLNHFQWQRYLLWQSPAWRDHRLLRLCERGRRLIYWAIHVITFLEITFIKGCSFRMFDYAGWCIAAYVTGAIDGLTSRRALPFRSVQLQYWDLYDCCKVIAGPNPPTMEIMPRWPDWDWCLLKRLFCVCSN